MNGTPCSQYHPTRQDMSFLEARNGVDWQGAVRIHDAPPATTTTTTNTTYFTPTSRRLNRSSRTTVAEADPFNEDDTRISAEPSQLIELQGDGPQAGFVLDPAARLRKW